MANDKSEHTCSSSQPEFGASCGSCCGHSHPHNHEQAPRGEDEMSFDDLPRSGKPAFTGKVKTRGNRTPS